MLLLDFYPQGRSLNQLFWKKKRWKWIIMITVYSIFLTIIVYKLSRWFGQRYSSPLTSPVFLSTLIIIILLVLSHISYQEYIPAKKIMTYLLGPATVALAVPIYKNRNLIAKNMERMVLKIVFYDFTTNTCQHWSSIKQISSQLWMEFTFYL